MAESKTARASAVKTVSKETVELTTESAIREIRNLRAGKLFVSNMEYVDKLLEAYDQLLKTFSSAETAEKAQNRQIIDMAFPGKE